MHNTQQVRSSMAVGRHLTVNGVRLWVEDSGRASAIVPVTVRFCR
jgi:hypothetical protein